MESNRILECIPQNDLDCYYNTKWKQVHKLYGNNINNNKTSINNFTLIQDSINDEMYNFIIDAKQPHGPAVLLSQNPRSTSPFVDKSTPSKVDSNQVLHNLVAMRNSYYVRNEHTQIFMIYVQYIQNISDIAELSNVVRTMTKFGIPTLFTVSVIPHFREPDLYALSLGEIPLTFDSKEMYDAKSQDLIEMFSSMLKDIYNYITEDWNYNMSNMVDFTRNIIIMEILFSKTILTVAQSIDPKITHNSASYQDFLIKFDTNDFWKTILDEHFNLMSTNEFNDTKYIFYENEKSLLFIKKFIQKLAPSNSKELSMIKDYLIYCLIKKYGLYTDIIGTFDKILPQQLDAKDLFVELFYDTFGYYLQDLHESKHSDPEKNKQVRQIFNDMKSYCIDIFHKTTIFDDNTRLAAINKLQALDIIIGKQKYDVDYLSSDVPSLGTNFYGNLMLMDEFHLKKQMQMVGKPINRYYLSVNNDLYSFVVNAYYEPIANMMYVPTSIINDMFFKLDADPIYNYGSLGSIIGHEIMHSFDNYGSLFDYHGHLSGWWTANDHLRYNNEIDKVRHHYSMFMINDTKIDSQLSVAENIADIAGIKLSFRTYMKHYMPNTNINHLTLKEKSHLKKFFERWAETLRTIDSDNSIDYSIKTDVHAPNIIRVNAPFSHLDEFYQIFDVKPEHQNYLDEKLRTKFLDI